MGWQDLASGVRGQTAVPVVPVPLDALNSVKYGEAGRGAYLDIVSSEVRLFVFA
jgi:hypothetical protein